MNTSRSQRLRWNEAKTIKFIKLYKHNRCLWDPDDPGYKNKYTRESAYRAVVASMDDVEFTTKCVRNKIRNLRSTYFQELKKMKEAIETAGEPYKPQLCWFYEMDSFLGDLSDKRPSVMITEDETELDSDIFEADEHPLRVMKSECESSESESEKVQDAKISETVEEVDEPPSKRRRDDVEIVSNVINRLQNIATILDGTSRAIKEDEFYFFGLNVAAQLRKLPLEVALQTQTEIQNKLSMARARKSNGEQSVQIID